MTVQDLRQIDQLLTRRLRQELKGLENRFEKKFVTKQDLKETENRILTEMGITGKAILDAVAETGVFNSEIDIVKQRVSIIESNV